jgi:soluble lytic murein transglycosylase-like protein
MNALERRPILLALVILLLYGDGQHPVQAEVDISTVADPVNSSNIQVDSSRSIEEPAGQMAAATANQTDLIPAGQIALVSADKIAVVPETYSGRPTFNISDKAIYDKMVNEVARKYGLESALLHAVISVESRYSPKAVSKKGAAGLMQLMPEIAKRYGVADPLDPVQNLRGGARYLRYLLKKYNNDRNLALAAYNAGERSVAKYGNRIPPYPETTNYVPRVMGYYRKYQIKG